MSLRRPAAPDRYHPSVQGRFPVGFVGLGKLGTGMAEAMRRAGWPLHVWARRPASLEPFVGLSGVEIVDSRRELGARCELVGVCVTADADVEAVVLGDDGVLAGMDRGGVIAVHSTVSPSTCLGLAAIAAERGVTVVDAPVDGHENDALEGHLTVMVGGDLQVFERIRPVLSSYGEPITHLGPLGAAQVVKLLNNLLFTANLGLALEALELGIAIGADPVALQSLFLRGWSRSGSLESWSCLIPPEGVDHLALLLGKDVSHALDELERRSLASAPLVAAARAALDRIEDPPVLVPPGSLASVPPGESDDQTAL
jgi:3-hydroxyisobutyrate dehydrogenase-like beta-hydroxyacid dehydrogenase